MRSRAYTCTIHQVVLAKHLKRVPKVLCVGGVLSDRTGTGVYLRRLFGSWPAESVASVAASDSVQQPDWRSCCQHYCLGDAELKLTPLLRPFVPPRLSRILNSNVSQPHVVSGQEGSAPEGNYARHFARMCWRGLLKIAGGGEAFYRFGISKQLLDYVTQFNPDVIYGQCSSLTSVRVLANIQKAFPVPLVVHCMDDWPTVIYTRPVAERLYRQVYLMELFQLMKSADLLIGICEEMTAEYRNRYNRPVHYVGMPVDLKAYEGVSRQDWGPGRPFRLQFAGRVGWALNQSLSDIAHAIESLNSEGMNIILEIFTFNPLQLEDFCRESACVQVKDAIEPNELAHHQALADVLVVCLDHGTLPYRQARYSMPSKLPGCLASGTPILAYGPRGLPFIEYARRSGYGIVVDVRDACHLKAAIRNLFNSTELRESYGRKGMALAAKYHDAKVISLHFQELVARAAVHPE